MHPEEYKKARNAFLLETARLRKTYLRALQTGSLDKSLADQISGLKKKEEALMAQAMIYYRARVLQKRPAGAVKTLLVKNLDFLNEAGLNQNDKTLIQKMRDTMQQNGLLAGYGCLDLPEALPENPCLNREEPDFTPILAVHNERSGFLFGDDGSVRLMENNEGWAIRQAPILEECYVQNAVMQSDSSCLILNLDDQIEQIRYHRICSDKDLLEEPVEDFES